MKRRQALQLSGTLAFAVVSGCLGSDDELATDGTDDDPIDADVETLLLTEDAIADILGGGWTESEPEAESLVRDADAATGFIPYDGEEFHDAGTVTTAAYSFDDVDPAREEFDDHPYQNGWGFEEREIAVESIAGTVDQNDARVVFREANAMGAVSYKYSDESEDELEATALELAVSMHEAWRTD